MATKDWKKTASNAIGIVWKNFKKEKQIEVVSFWNGYRFLEKKFFDIRFMKIEQFKTKTAALKYAKAYMRKH